MSLNNAILSSLDFPRAWVPAALDCGDWSQLEPLFAQLLARPLDSAAQLEQWIIDQSELTAVVDQDAAVRQINMTCHTDDPQLEQLYITFVTEIMPKLEEVRVQLARHYLASPARAQLDRMRYEVLDRSLETEARLFREENIALNVEDELLGQQYQKICGEMTGEFDGATRTMPQLAKVLEETDRARRQSAWQVMVGRRLQDADAIDDIFDKMVALRHTMATNAGYENFVDYQFCRYRRFDYTPEDCCTFHDAVESVVMPLYRDLLEKRGQQLGLAELAPWDLKVDPQGREPLRPFETAAELVAGCREIFAAIDEGFAGEFDILSDKQLLDLDSRKGKAPGGYQCTLEEARLPFIFMNAAGRNTDVFTLLHEGGHAFHALATRREPFVAYRSAPIEFCEVASMGMETMACERMDAFYTPENARRAREQRLTEVIEILPWIARIDAFQLWIYTHPQHTRAERREQWRDLELRFGTGAYAGGFEQWSENSWQAQLHLFGCPLYYIEYGIAELGALQLWNRFRQNPQAAVAGYRAALAIGGARPLPELFQAAGLEFAMSADTMRPLVAQLCKELA